MLFKMGEAFMHTVTVLRFKDGSLAIDRATLEEAKQIVKWFDEGTLSFDVEKNMFMINSTGFNKMLGKNIHVMYVTWFREMASPFFGNRDIGMGKGFNTMCLPSNSVYSYFNSELAYQGPRGADHKYEDFMMASFAERPDPDADPSIPEELEVEKDEQILSPTEVTRQAWLEHQHEAKPLLQVKLDGAVHQLPAMVPFKNIGLSEEAIKERGRRICKVLGDFVDRIKGISKQCQDDINSIDEQMLAAHAVANTLDPSAIVKKAIRDSVAPSVSILKRIRAADPRDEREKIADRYIGMILSSKVAFSHYHRLSGEYQHISWMLQQMKMDKSISLTTLHRWIRFIKETVIVMGFTTEEKENDFYDQLLAEQ